MQLLKFALFVLAVLTVMLSGTQARPKGVGGAVRKGGKVIKHGLGAIGAIGAGHEIYEQVHNRG